MPNRQAEAKETKKQKETDPDQEKSPAILAISAPFHVSVKAILDTGAQMSVIGLKMLQ